MALGFKPIEGVLENALIAREMKLQRLEHEKQQKELEAKEGNVQKSLNIPKIEIVNNSKEESQTPPHSVEDNNNSHQSFRNVSRRYSQTRKETQKRSNEKNGRKP
ncbi:MAG: hypothetical protein KatS3mg035_0882 [Bacteroidia bacterium]|nr:MAG: hypothetical protein KatS3mg035_0882 [Bacteroidia bacterium]